MSASVHAMAPATAVRAPDALAGDEPASAASEDEVHQDDVRKLLEQQARLSERVHDTLREQQVTHDTLFGAGGQLGTAAKVEVLAERVKGVRREATYTRRMVREAVRELKASIKDVKDAVDEQAKRSTFERTVFVLVLLLVGAQALKALLGPG